VAPGGHHLELEFVADRAAARVVPSRARDKYAPSVDRLFTSAAKLYGADLLAIVLTGMGDDGALGARAVADAGGAVIAESGESAVIFGMPQQAIRTGAVDQVLPLHEMAAAIQGGAHRAPSGTAAASARRACDAGRVDT
jgi:two-component system chemotaxis response regulator CheB